MANKGGNISPESFPMVGGDGDHSYAKNSSYQREVADVAKEMISEAIAEKLDLKSLGLDTSSNTFQLADLGCSVGPNTFFVVQNIIDAVELKYHAEAEHHHQNASTLEFQVFFNDHSENDFNTLFNNLPLKRKYFAAGVPGSFHGRLFPKCSLHFVSSSYAVHWLSKIPKEIVDRKSPAWNKGNIHCTGFVTEVAEAYLAQFRDDIESFLNARAQELVPGGLIAIVLSGRPSGGRISETTEGKVYDFLGSCLTDMSKMGLLNEERVNSFNLPVYSPTSEELQAITRRIGCFTIERMEILRKFFMPTIISAQSIVAQIRAIFEGVIQEHFGSDFVDQIFNYFFTKFSENISILEEIKENNKVNLFMLLKRN